MFVDSGEFFWNAGIFIWKAQTVIDAFKQYLPEISQRFESCVESFGRADGVEAVQQQLAACPNISIDYGIMEKSSNVYVLCSNFGWSDVGTWGALYELAQKDACENAVLHGRSICYDSHRNVVSAADGKLVILEGLEDYIVTDSDDVLLVCRRSEEQRIRQFVNDAKTRFGNEYV